MSIEQRLMDLGIELPARAVPLANYVGAVQVGDLLHLSGHLPLDATGKLAAAGRLGAEIDVEAGQGLARQVGINLLSTIHGLTGDLDRVRRVVKVVGFIRSAPGFSEQPKVLNGVSDLLVEVFGREVGQHARSAVGVSELPLGAPVEAEMIVQVA